MLCAVRFICLLPSGAAERGYSEFDLVSRVPGENWYWACSEKSTSVGGSPIQKLMSTFAGSCVVSG
jgi:hypothetical protein